MKSSRNNRIIGLAATLTVIVLALLAALWPDDQRPVTHASGLAVPSAQTVDYDADDDGLIEISNLEQLNAIRWDLIGNGKSDNSGYAAAFPNAVARSCPDHSRPGSFSGCLGYELTKDLDFDDAGSYASGSVNTAWTSGAGWQPIGSWHSHWRGTFQGNGHTISNLFINRPESRTTGLFGTMGAFSAVKRLGLVDAKVTGGASGGAGSTGAVAGHNIDGTVDSSYGSVTVSGSTNVGGLVGFNTTGTISSSYVTGTVNGTSYRVGGLLGGNSGGTIQESYSMAAVSADSLDYGGLVGQNDSGGRIRNSYSAGKVSGSGERGGGLVGRSVRGGTVSNSYYDAPAAGRSEGIGAKSVGELKWPTSATGIYASWPRARWDFGTASDYPVLLVDFNGDGTASWQEFGQQTRTSPPVVSYDNDYDGLLEIKNLEQLNAIRWDVDGDGLSTHSDHAAAFPNPSTYFGCLNGCSGYELAADLDFKKARSYASGSVNSAWTSGAGWMPIGGVNELWLPLDNPDESWNATFSGSGHTISNLYINRGGSIRVGLFGAMSGSGRIKRLGLVDANVTSGMLTGALVGESRGGNITHSYVTATVDGGSRSGGLVGEIHSGGRIKASYVTGTVKRSGSRVGGMVGNNSSGVVEESYSTAAVGGNDTVGGLVGMNEHGATIRNSYSTGRPWTNSRFVGGLTSSNWGGSVVSNSYYDTQTSHRSGGLGAKTTAELQSPTSASGIYANWNQSLWDFGTASDYPLLSVDFNGDGTASWQGFGQQTRIVKAMVTSIAITSEPGQDATYAIGDTVNVAATFDEDMTVTGTPQLALDLDGAARSAAYTGTEGAVVSFVYTVAEGDTASNGVAVPANALTLNGGSIRDSADVEADLTREAVAADAGHKVDGVRPTFVSASVPAAGTTIVLEYSEDIMVPPLLRSIIDNVRVSLSLFYIAVTDVWVGERSVSLTGGAISNNEMTINVRHPIGEDQDVAVSYDNIFAADAPGLLIDTAGNPLLNYGSQDADNQSTQTVSDRPDSALSLSATEITVPEGQSKTYTVQLSAQPSADMTVRISAPQGETTVAGDKHELPGGLLIDEVLLTFTSENWDTPQTLTLEAPEDDNRRYQWVGLVNFTSSTDAAFNSHRARVRIVIEDND